jgi:hypothetical protein
VIIKTRKVDPCAEGGARILIKESSRDASSLEKSSTDTIKEINVKIVDGSLPQKHYSKRTLILNEVTHREGI